MARIAGVDLPMGKRIDIGLTYIFGIGSHSSMLILKESGVEPTTKVKDLTGDEVARLRAILEDKFQVEGDLKKAVAMDIRRLMDIGSYRGLRHRLGLPVRGQRTKTNARTRKGRKAGSPVAKKSR